MFLSRCSKKIYGWKKAYEKMFNISSHCGNVNSNVNKMVIYRMANIRESWVKGRDSGYLCKSSVSII